jgi:hypothetical protein
LVKRMKNRICKAATKGSTTRMVSIGGYCRPNGSNTVRIITALWIFRFGTFLRLLPSIWYFDIRQVSGPHSIGDVAGRVAVAKVKWT